jgi:S1-C subfamily serine protease
MDRITGVYVNSVTPGGAAEDAGVRDGDVITAIDGKSVNASNELQSAVARRRPGETLDVELWRRGSVQSLDITLLGRDAPAYDRWFSELRREQAEPDLPLEPEDRPGTEQEDVFEVGEWGIGIRDATSRERDQFDISEGVYIAYVENGSIADDAGLPRDVIITEISGEAVTSTEHALRILEEAAQFEQSILFRVKRRNGITAFYEMEVPVPAG